MCDTFVVCPSATKDGSVIFGKNSDREPNEAQVLEFIPSGSFSGAENVKCTYISIPQVKETYASLICRPFWMWGAEMGANEKGVVIGNEAVFTKMPIEKKGKLTGMDMIRLALERASTAEQGLDIIIQLLTDHGQGGICGYDDKNLFYHNSFIIADKKSAWVLETAGHLWAALEVKDVYSISNGLTIGEEFDESHPDLIKTAQEKGWLKKGKDFSFAKCYSDWFYTTFSACHHRRGCSFDLISARRGKMEVSDAFDVLRYHHDEPYQPDSHFLLKGLCIHGGNGLARNSATAGSLVAHLTRDTDTFWATGTSAPCTSIFKPIWIEGDVLPDLGPTPNGTYNSDTLWWQHEKLHRTVLEDFSRTEDYKQERDILEATFLKNAYETSQTDRFKITSEAFDHSAQAVNLWQKKIETQPISNRAGFVFRNYWKKTNKNARIS